MTRLVEKINTYNIELRFKKGCENQGADFLSRHAILKIKQFDRYEKIKAQQKEDPVTHGTSGS